MTTFTSASGRSGTADRLERHRARSAAHLAERVPVHLARLDWTPDQIHEHQRAGLADLLAHAAEHSPFHARRLAGIDLAGVDPGDPESLARLPVMSKAELMAHYDDVVTDPRLTRSAIEAHIAGMGDRLELFGGDYLVFASGGSSGVRGLFAWHWATASDYGLGMIRRSVAALLAAGGPPPGGVPMAMVTGARPVHATAACTALFSGDVFRMTSIPASRPLPEIVEALNALQPVILSGYPRALAALAHERSAGRLTVTPRSITSTSELLDAPTAARINAAFGVPIVNQFGSSEGLLGASEPGSEWIEIADDCAVVELVDDEDRPVRPGKPSSSVLVTSLLNRAQPLIRYRLEDSLVALPAAAADAAATPAGTGHLRVRVAGRADQVFRYGSVEVAPAVLRAVLAATPDVLDYQVRQTRGGLDVAVVALESADGDALAGLLRAVLADAGLDGADVRVRRVAVNPADALSAKVRRFVPL